jgi:hypothetical protein
MAISRSNTSIECTWSLFVLLKERIDIQLSKSIGPNWTRIEKKLCCIHFSFLIGFSSKEKVLCSKALHDLAKYKLYIANPK